MSKRRVVKRFKDKCVRRTKERMKLVFISDTHGLHSKISVPDGDVLIHCGDFSGNGSVPELVAFNEWLGTLPHKHKIVSPGNHDRICEQAPALAASLFTNATLVIHDGFVIDGVSFFCSPYTPIFGYWSFMKSRGTDIRRVWETMPDSVDVLVTHGPPEGVLDAHVGCVDLLRRLCEIKPKVHAFGHIHEGAGQELYRGIQCVNASICDGSYRPINPPITVTI